MALEYKEVGRVTISEKTEMVVSRAFDGNKLIGYTINKFITTDRYKGFGSAVLIPKDIAKKVASLLVQK